MTSEAATKVVFCVKRERQRGRCKAGVSDREAVDMNARGMQGVDARSY